MTCKDCIGHDIYGCSILDTYIKYNNDICYKFKEDKYKKMWNELKEVVNKLIYDDKAEFILKNMYKLEKENDK